MGYTTLLDILGSIVIGGLLLLTIMRIYANQTENNIVYGSDRIVQRNLVEVAVILEGELRKIGYCADPNVLTSSSKIIINADSCRITFVSDLEKRGILDTINYYIGPTSELSYTPNPRDRILYRKLNSNNPNAVSYGVTEFALLYFDALNDTLTFPISDPKLAKSLQVSFKVEDGAAYNNQYSTAYWRLLRLSTRNLSNR